jgi:hypothetical protein
VAEPQPQSPEWWLAKLYDELADRQPEMKKLDNYYCGDHPLPFLTKAHNSKMRDEFRQLLEDSRSNFMRLVIDAVEERLQVEGFRLSAETDETAEQESWKIWQANQMDAEASSAFIEALVKGVAYLSVWEGDEFPTIAVEDPFQTIVSYAPGSNFRQRAAALKVWTDDISGMKRANVYLPDAIHKFQASTDINFGGKETPRWMPLASGDAVVKNPLNIVPIIPIRNRPRVLCEGESEIADLYRIQNQINGFLFLLALGGYFGAHKQRWAVGLTIMEDETTGQPREPFDVDIGKLWVASAGEDGGTVQFGEFSQTDLTGYLKAIEQKVLHIAVISRTPRHYLFQEGQSPSGDAIKSAESGLVKKVEKKQRPFGEGLEEVMRLARRFAGAQDTPVDSEIVWADAQTESESAITDAVIKQYEAELIPWAAALEKLGYTQTQIARFASMRQQDALQREVERARENVNLNISA